MKFDKSSSDIVQMIKMKKGIVRKSEVTVRLWALDYDSVRSEHSELFDKWNNKWSNHYTPTDEERPLWDKLDYIHSYHGVDFDLANSEGEFKFENYTPKYETQMEYDGTERSVAKIYDYFVHQGNVWTGEVIQAGDDFWYIEMFGFKEVTDTFRGKF